jgi:hypothetical protein
MIKTLGNFVLFVWSKFKITSNLAVENLALRQQLVVMKRVNKRPEIRMADRLFWVVFSRIWTPWRTFLKNHANNCSIDFFTVPTAAFNILFVLVVLSHSRRKVVHFNVISNPTADWTAQQVLEAFPWDTAPKYLMRDRDAIYMAFSFAIE